MKLRRQWGAKNGEQFTEFIWHKIANKPYVKAMKLDNRCL